MRDAVLEIRYVSAEGVLVTAGGPMIKNVSGFDLCRLLVGSLGTLGLIGEVVLRTRPVPEAEAWLTGPVDPDVALAELATAVTVFWDGATTWVRLSGLGVDVAAETERAAAHRPGAVRRPAGAAAGWALVSARRPSSRHAPRPSRADGSWPRWASGSCTRTRRRRRVRSRRRSPRCTGGSSPNSIPTVGSIPAAIRCAS